MTTKHTCGGPVFGKLAAERECPRCDELRSGMPAVKWAPSRAAQSRLRCEEIRAHFNSKHHRSGGCGPVCTFGDW